jgi:hypothetical protein
MNYIESKDTVMTWEEFGKLCMPSPYKFKTAKEELIGWNIYANHEAITRKKDKSIDDLAILFVCKYLMNCVENDPTNGDYYNKTNNDIMKKAGRLLHSIEGEGYMRDIMEAFIPKRYRRSVDHIWSGIGCWLA